MTTIDWQTAQDAFRQGGLLAYPTEAVFGLGCDPRNAEAVDKLLALKQRERSKGLILVAADYSQLLPYVDDLAIPQDKRFQVFSSWPGAVTLLLPAAVGCPDYLRGDHHTIAVRVTAHEPTRQLCKQLRSALVSTSANRSGEAALCDAAAVRAEFGSAIDWIMDAPVGGASTPSRIINPLTGEQLRGSTIEKE